MRLFFSKLIKETVFKNYLIVRSTLKTDQSLRMKKLLQYYSITKIFDIGAHQGESGIRFRKLGFCGPIISIEPIQSEFEKLQATAKKDPDWIALNLAIGEANYLADLHVSAKSDCSSFLPISVRHLVTESTSASTKKQQVQIVTLDSIFENYYHTNDNVFIKIDVQGFEKKVLEGMQESLEKIVGLKIELSNVELYKDQALVDEILPYLYKKNFILCSVEPGFVDTNTGQLLQIDGVFFRDKASNQVGT